LMDTGRIEGSFSRGLWVPMKQVRSGIGISLALKRGLLTSFAVTTEFAVRDIELYVVLCISTNFL